MRAPVWTALWITGVVTVAGCSSHPSPAPVPATTTNSTAPSPEAAKAGSQPRRMVKVAMDPDASKIGTSPVDTTIEAINSQKPPLGTIGGRVAPFETTQWKVRATLKSVQLMKDGDFYLVLKGDKGGQSVVEVPDAAQCKGSPLATQITAARQELESRYHPTTTLKPLNDDATVTGVGFLGWGGAGKKGGKGRSGPRLMPGTGFSFGK